MSPTKSEGSSRLTFDGTARTWTASLWFHAISDPGRALEVTVFSFTDIGIEVAVPTKLPRPWDSPGKNTGVGCHFLLQCMKVKSESGVARSCPTLSDLMDCNLPGSSIHGVFQERVLEWGAIDFSERWQCLSRDWKGS